MKPKPPKKSPAESEHSGADFAVRDRRFWARKDEQETAQTPKPETAAADANAATAAQEIERLATALRLLREEQRRINERRDRDLNNQVAALKVQVLAPLIDLLDDLERCGRSLEAVPAEETRSAAPGAAGDGSLLAATRTGLDLIVQRFQKTLHEAGVTRLTLTGKPYRPDQAEAIATESCDDPNLDNVVLEEYRSGYMLGDRLIRPARVRVGMAPPAAAATEGEEDAASRSSTGTGAGHSQT
jgi:molecular chaperone GrpE